MLMKWSPDLKKSFMIIILVMNFEANFHDLDNDHELIKVTENTKLMKNVMMKVDGRCDAIEMTNCGST